MDRSGAASTTESYTGLSEEHVQGMLWKSPWLESRECGVGEIKRHTWREVLESLSFEGG